jgi:hypothetical protein
MVSGLTDARDKEVTRMAATVEGVPPENRWAIATQALTGANMATDKALLDIVGQETYEEINGQIWAEGGKAAKQIADALGLTGDDAKSAAETNATVAAVTMGPEFEFETVEATAERAVMRCENCPWWNRMQEMGISDDLCSSGDQGFSSALVGSLNPNLVISLTKAMPRGDAYCEWVCELQE